MKRILIATAWAVAALTATTHDVYCENVPRPREVRGEAIYYLDEDDNVAHARSMALQMAKSNAIQSEFGTAVTSSSHTSASMSSDGFEQESFSSMIRTLSMGAWLRDISEPVVEGFTALDGRFGFKATVHGLVREISSVPIEIDGEVLTPKGTGNTIGIPTRSLIDGDEFFFRFRAASDGFLSVFLIDEEGMVCRAAPATSGVPIMVQAGMAKTVKDPRVRNRASITDPDRREVHNQVVFIFSTEPFSLPLADSSLAGDGLPPMTDYEQFHAWLQQMAVAYPHLTVSSLDIVIRR